MARRQPRAAGRSCGFDASPRGGPAGFVHSLDDQTIAFADWPGNNRIESMRNLTEDDRVGMLFLFPGLDVFMRVNGRGGVSEAPELLRRVAEGERTPKSAIVVHVEEALFHCGKAINRAQLWDEASRLDGRSLSSVGTILKGLAELDDVSAEALDARYEEGVKRELY